MWQSSWMAMVVGPLSDICLEQLAMPKGFNLFDGSLSTVAERV
jgi:hypothetical protein